MTDDEREALRQMAMAAKARANKARRGPWVVSPYIPSDGTEQRMCRHGSDFPAAYTYVDGSETIEFIAAARQDVPALADAVLRLLEELAEETKRADDWCEEAQRRWCQKCKHPHGPVAMPQGWQQMGEVVYTCPCDCHADVPALRRQLAEVVAALETFGEDGCPGKDAEWCQCAYCAARRIVRRARAAQPPQKEGV